MKKSWKSLILAGFLSLSLTVPVFAGSWQLDANGYWYENDDHSYPANTWQWIDGNSDGIAESYYFNENGYFLVNTTTPDGFTVDGNGAWIVDGVVQTKAVSATSSAAPAQTQNQPSQSSAQTQTQDSQPPAQTQTQNVRTSGGSRTGVSSSPYDGYTIIVNTNTKKYHYPSCRAVNDMKSKNMGYSDDSVDLGALGYVPCKICH